MNNQYDEAAGEQCGICGGRIDEGDGHIVYEDGEPIAYAHTACA